MTETTQSEIIKEKASVLVCLSPSPSTLRVIHAAAKFTSGTNTKGIALYVGDTEYDAQLLENIRIAKENGFEVHTIESSDIPVTIAEYAKRAGITDLFLGYSAQSSLFQSRKSISEELAELLPKTDLHIIPDSRASSVPKMHRSRGKLVWNFRDLLTVLAVMTAATLLSAWFYQSRYSNANIITVYLLAVLIASFLTSHVLYGILSAVLYILLFNFLFIDPRFTLLVYDSEYLITYLVTVIAALLTGMITSRMKHSARISAENAYRAKVLLDTSNQLETAGSPDELIRITCMQLVHLLNRTVLFYREKTIPANPEIYPAKERGVNQLVLENEREAVMWTHDNNHQSGAFTSHFQGSAFRYLNVSSDTEGFGVIGIDMNGIPFTEFENTILLAIIREFAMALENERMREERRAAEVSAENERLKSGLLRSLSHDLRTPLTSIYGNASNLLSNGSKLPESDKEKIYGDMMEDSFWLNTQMENILSMTKLENENYLHMTTENMEDVIEESLRHIAPHPGHTVEVEEPEDLCFAEMDPRLIVQVLVNLLNNAIKYTPEGSKILVRYEKKDRKVIVSVIDNGNGIPEKDKEHIFELFYTGEHSLTDAYRRMGIGLNLCYMIIKAHKGTIKVSDNYPHGAVFTFTLAAKEVTGVE